VGCTAGERAGYSLRRPSDGHDGFSFDCFRATALSGATAWSACRMLTAQLGSRHHLIAADALPAAI